MASSWGNSFGLSWGNAWESVGDSGARATPATFGAENAFQTGTWLEKQRKKRLKKMLQEMYEESEGIL